MKNIELTITREDYENSNKYFTDVENCPLAIAVKRVTRWRRVVVDSTRVLRLRAFFNDKEYKLQNPFTYNDYYALVHNNTAFTTQLIPV